MTKKFSNIIILASILFLLTLSQTMAAAINLSAPSVLGDLKLSAAQLKAVKKAVKEAFNNPIDAESQCGEINGDCVVRAARQWSYEGVTYREIVINIHTVGHASITAEKVGGKWPEVKTK